MRGVGVDGCVDRGYRGCGVGLECAWSGGVGLMDWGSGRVSRGRGTNSQSKRSRERRRLLITIGR